MTPTVQPTEYTISALPEHHHEYHLFALRVRRRAGDHWHVEHVGYTLTEDGDWAHPRSEPDTWGYDEAIRRGLAAATTVTVNGFTAADVLAWGGGRP